MPKKSSSKFTATPTTTLALSSLHIRLETLDKQHQSLLKQIKRKRTELNNFVEQTRSLATEIFSHCSPHFQNLADIDQEIHSLFDEIFAKRKFGKQTKKDIERIYHQLQLAGIITPKSVNQDEDTEIDELDDDNNQEQNFYGRSAKEYDQELEYPSRNQTEASRKIRQIFLNLATIFHPDKVKDDATQIRYTEIMKEINKAYQEGDLARLLEIERQHQVGKSIDSNNQDDLTRRCNQLEQQNQLLKKQYESIKQELNLVKNTPEGTMVSDCRKAKRAGLDPISQLLEQVESEIQTIALIRDFIRDFREEKITVKQFLNGPVSLRQSNQEMMEDFLERMFIDLEDLEIF